MPFTTYIGSYLHRKSTKPWRCNVYGCAMGTSAERGLGHFSMRRDMPCIVRSWCLVAHDWRSHYPPALPYTYILLSSSMPAPCAATKCDRCINGAGPASTRPYRCVIGSDHSESYPQALQAIEAHVGVYTSRIPVHSREEKQVYCEAWAIKVLAPNLEQYVLSVDVVRVHGA